MFVLVLTVGNSTMWFLAQDLSIRNLRTSVHVLSCDRSIAVNLYVQRSSFNTHGEIFEWFAIEGNFEWKFICSTLVLCFVGWFPVKCFSIPHTLSNLWGAFLNEILHSVHLLLSSKRWSLKFDVLPCWRPSRYYVLFALIDVSFWTIVPIGLSCFVTFEFWGAIKP